MILAHELSYILKTSDKYNPDITLPAFPDGFAEPEKQALYPQDLAELMSGRIPISKIKSEIPQSLSFTTIGNKTVEEIG